MRIREFEAVTDLGETMLAGEISPGLKRRLQEVFQEAFAGDYIDFMVTAEKEIPTLFEAASLDDTFEDIIGRWVENHMRPILH